MENRNKTIIRTGIIGILLNILLVAVKMVIGLFSGSIAIILDAINNLSDALSSLINIIGTKLASRSPDKKHPYGHGRVEYIATILISLMVLFAGVTSFKEAVMAIWTGQKASYNAQIVVILVIVVLVKFFMSRYFIKKGNEVNSKPLILSGKEARFDAILSLGTLLCACVSLLWGLSLEGWVGAIIALLIIKTGGEMLTETLAVIIGLRSERELTGQLKALVNSFPEVHGTYDVILHNYGPTQHIGSVHIEVSEDLNARDIHHLTMQITEKVYVEMNIVLTVGIYAGVHSDSNAVALRKSVGTIIKEYPAVMQMHGFYLNDNIAGFDLVIDFKADSIKIREEIIARLEEMHPDYTFKVLLDLDYSD